MVFPYGDPVVLIGRRLRTRKRAMRAQALYKWATGAVQSPDPDSNLALDDRDFLSGHFEKGLVAAHALLPTMSAVDHLAVAAEKSLESDSNGQLHSPTTLALCRVALESSSRTIWLLSPTDRATRRCRAAACALKEAEEEAKYLRAEVAAAEDEKSPVEMPDERLHDLKEGQKALSDIVKDLKVAAGDTKVAGFKETTGLAGAWLDANIPAHDEGEMKAYPMALGAKQIYSSTSSVVHGFQWFINQLSPADLFGVIADSFAAAVNMTECAVALCEVHAQSPSGSTSRVRRYPELIEPTIHQWRTLYY